MSMSGVYGITSDVIAMILIINDTWVLLEGLKDKWDATLHEAKLF